MKITPIPHGLDLLASDLVRSSGLHMSQIYGSLYEALEPERFKGDEPNPLMLALGTAWEQYFERQLDRAKSHIFRPGELISPEGIAYSPDGVIENGHLTMVEYKLTWMSSNADIADSKFDKYRTQMLSYAYQLETSHARLYVLFVNGNYKPPSPMLKAWNFEFSVRELNDNWTMLMNHARHKGMI